MFCRYVNDEDGSCNTADGKCMLEYLRLDYKPDSYDEEENR